MVTKVPGKACDFTTLRRPALTAAQPATQMCKVYDNGSITSYTWSRPDNHCCTILPLLSCLIASIKFTTLMLLTALQPTLAFDKAGHGTLTGTQPDENTLNKKQTITLESQPVDQVLQQLSTIYGVPFSVKSADVANIRTRRLEGQFSLTEALTQLFTHTPLTYTHTPHGFIITKKPAVQPLTSLTEEIRVYGSTQEALTAHAIKYDTDTITDVLGPRELSQNPHLNLAESLQRLPGVTITREAGEGRLVSLRGISPDFSLVTLNGMPVLANSDSPMDSRGQKQRDRSFDFNIFSAELFNKVQALKAYSATESAGGIAGTIALQTAQPFDNPGLQGSASVQVGENSLTNDQLAMRTSVQISNTWQHWGGLLSYYGNQRDSHEIGANTFRWRNIAIDDADLTNLNPATQDNLRNGLSIVPRGNRYSVWKNDQRRHGLGATLQFLNDAHNISFDAVHSTLNGNRDEYHLYPRGSQSTPIIPNRTRVIEAESNDANELVYARYTQGRVAVESRQQKVSTGYKQLVLNAEHQFMENHRLVWLAGTETSDFHIPLSNKVYMQGESDVAIDYRKDRHFAHIQYSGTDLLAADNWAMTEIDQEYYRATTQYDTLKLSAHFNHEKAFSWELGGEYVQFTNSALSLFNSDVLKPQWAAYNDGNNDDEVEAINSEIPQQYSHVLLNHPKQNWLVLQVHPTLLHFGITPNLLNNSNLASRLEGDLVEKSQALYMGAQWSSDSFSLQGAIRHQQHQTESTFTENLAYQNTWDITLPSVNMSWRFQHDWIARLGLSKNITKPKLSDFFTTPRYDQESLTVYDTNSYLLPYRAQNIDLSLEAYELWHSFFSTSFFWKKIDDYIISQAEDKPFGEVEAANYWVDEPFAADEIITSIKRQNAETVTVYGLETHLTHRLSYLRRPWKDLSVTAQVSVFRGEQDYYDDNSGNFLFQKTLPFLSKKSGALAVTYENPKVRVKLSSTYRDDYIYRVNSQVLSDEDETGFHSSVYIDAQFTFQYTPRWALKLEAFNLSNQRQEQYSDSSDRAYNTSLSGRSIYIGISFQR